jgi:histidinol-phosphate/aromatic aminotransferase/cobyric acid decarboxylase-like protein
VNLSAFVARRDALRLSRPELVDRSELNLYGALAPDFPRILPSVERDAQYRCHVSELYLTHLGLDGRHGAHVSHGVRRSLGAIFGLLASRQARVGLPGDVYPVYLQLAEAAGLNVVTYFARDGLPALDELDALVICDPLKPWGGTPAVDHARRLTEWARADERRMLLVDSAYAPKMTSVARSMLLDDVAIVLVSLSKGWLVPDHVGLCVTPQRWTSDVRNAFACLSKDEERLRIGYAALTEHVARPERVAARLGSLGSALDAWARRLPELRASPHDGYFAVSSLDFNALLELGVLAVPGTVFGGPAEVSVLSSLPPVVR